MDIAAFEERLLRVPGIEAVRVVWNGDAAKEVHVLTVPGKPPKQVVRDVQSVAMAGFGVEIDRRVVSVVQMHSTDLRDGDRPAIEDIAEDTNGSRSTVTVTLAWRDRKLVGTATGPSAKTMRLNLVADAALAALEQAILDETAVAVTGIDIHRVGSEEIAVAALVIVTNGDERVVAGSALVRQDDMRAATRAVLDALNRQFPNLARD